MTAPSFRRGLRPAASPLALMVLLLLAPGAWSQRTARSTLNGSLPLARRAALALGVSPGDLTLTRLSLPLEPGDELLLPLVLHGRSELIGLSRHDLRAPGFVLRAWLPDGSLVPVSMPPAATYRGVSVAGPGPELSVTASLGPLGLTAEIREQGGGHWSLRPLADLLPGTSRALHALVLGGVPEPPRPPCASAAPAWPTDADVAPGAAAAGVSPPPASAPSGGGDGPVGYQPPLGALPGAGLPGGAGLGGSSSRAGTPVGFPAPPHGCARRAQIAFDADFEYYQLQGSSVVATAAHIESLLDQVDFFYQRDLGVSYELTSIVVRTAPFYMPVSGGDLLDQFRAEWNSTLASVPRDLAHLMTAKPGNLIEFGGLAWVGVVCNLGLAYGWSLDSAGIIGHEVGHNWGAPHCLDPSPCNNMCGACLYIAPNTKAVKQAYMAGISCLDTVLMPTTPLPPYVVGEQLTVAKDDYFAKLSPRLIDVLKNEDDGNCQQPLLEGVDLSSEQGGSLILLPGAGPKGRDLVSYSAPDDLFVGQDHFGYQVGDGSGLQTPGQVSVDVTPLQLSGWWPLDEGVGSTASDLGDGQRHGTLEGAPAWTGGTFGSALQLDGLDDDVLLPAFDLLQAEISITAWVRRMGDQNDWSALLMSRAGGTHAGLHVGFNNELRYTWNNALDTYFWDSGLVLPDGVWAFCALVVEPTEARLYLGSDPAGGGVLSSATNAVSHSVQSFSGSSYMGWDPLSPLRHFRGAMDDVRVYDHALSATEIGNLFANGGGAELPLPSDGGGLVDSGSSLRWRGGLQAGNHDVYVGSGYAAVRDATPASPEYQGQVPATTFAPGGLLPGSRHYWRVDEITPAGTVPGAVWQFRVDAKGHWLLDEATGSTAADAHGLNPGVYGSGIGLSKTGATPFSGSSVRLHGKSPEEIVMAAPGLDSDRATLCAWVRRIGDQIDWSGLVFCRGGETVAGLNVGTDNELRYHWDGGNWDWNSGLVLPDAQWAFCAVVVEPTQATIWMGVEGAPLQSAVHVAGHGVEPFDAALRIGHDPAGARWFNGRLDDVRVFDRALAPKEIQQLYEDALLGTG